MFYGGTDGGYYPCKGVAPNVGYTDGAIFSNVLNKEKDEKFLGYTYGYMANRGEYRSPLGVQSQNKMYELGNNWVCLAITNYQKHFYSTEIYADFLRTPTDRDIEFFVNNAHRRGVKVCLKPMINCEDNMWRAHISFPDENMDEKNIYWNKWFDSYKHYILHYAELAQELKCEMLCIGCEMLGTEHRKYEWLYLIGEIRKVYSGKLIYNTNHDNEDDAEWLDALDYIGISAYYPVGVNGANREEMLKEWNKVKDKLNSISKRLHKKYIFMEIGCRSATSCSAKPWDFSDVNAEWNEDEQALFYETCCQTFLPDTHFAGMFWWDWSTFIYNSREEAIKDNGFNIHLKKAEEVIKKIYKSY